MGRFNQKKHVPFRLTSFFLTLFFSLSQPFNLYAESPQGEDSVSRLPIVDEASKLVLPTELGIIQERYKGSSGQTVILLQDAHAIPDAQRSIRQLIDFLQKNHGLRLVGIEGGSGRLEDRFFRVYPRPEDLKQVFEDYLSKGEISGAAAAAVTNEQPGEFYGVEDGALYEEELLAYHHALEMTPRLLEEIGRIAARLDELKKKHYPPALLEVDRLAARASDQPSETAALLRKLVEIKKPSGSGGFQVFVRELLRTDDDMKEAAVRHDIEKLTAELKNRIAEKEALVELNQKSQSYATSQMDARAFAAYLLDLARQHGVNSRRYVRLVKFSETLMTATRLRGPAFFKELETYLREVKFLLYPGLEARQIDELDGRLRLLVRLAHLKLTREDWTEFLNEKERYKPWIFEAFLAELEDSTAEINGLKVNAFQAKENEGFSFVPHLRFYEAAADRDRAFVENLTRLMKEQNVGSSDLLTGGFHTAGVAEQLKRLHISYVVISPRVAELPQETVYARMMAGDVSWKDYFEVRDGEVDLFDAFARATADRLAAKSHPDEAAAVLLEWRAALGGVEDAQYADKALAKIGGLSPEALRAHTFLGRLEKWIADGQFDENSLAEIFTAPAAMPPVSVRLLIRNAPAPAEIFPALREEKRDASEDIRPEAREERHDIRLLNRLADEFQLLQKTREELSYILEGSRAPYSNQAVRILVWLASNPKLPEDLRAEEVLWAVRELASKGVPGLNEALDKVLFHQKGTQLGFFSEILFAYQKQREGYEVLALDSKLPPNVEVDIVLMRRRGYHLQLFSLTVELDRRLNERIDRLFQNPWLRPFLQSYLRKGPAEITLAESKYFMKTARSWLQKRMRRYLDPDRWMNQFLVPKIEKYLSILEEERSAGELALESYVGVEDFEPPSSVVMVVSDSILQNEFERSRKELVESYSRLPDAGKTAIEFLPTNLSPQVRKELKLDSDFSQIFFRPGRDFATRLAASHRAKPAPKPRLARTKTPKREKMPVVSQSPDSFLNDMLEAYADESYIPIDKTGKPMPQTMAWSGSRSLDAIYELMGHRKQFMRQWLFDLARSLNGDLAYEQKKKLVGDWLILDAEIRLPATEVMPENPEDLLAAWRDRFQVFAAPKKSEVTAPADSGELDGVVRNLAAAALDSETPERPELRSAVSVLPRYPWPRIELRFRRELEPVFRAAGLPDDIREFMRENPTAFFEMIHEKTGLSSAVPEINPSLSVVLHPVVLPRDEDRLRRVGQTVIFPDDPGNRVVLPYANDGERRMAEGLIRVTPQKDKVRPVSIIPSADEDAKIDLSRAEEALPGRRAAKYLSVMPRGRTGVPSGERQAKPLLYELDPEIYGVLEDVLPIFWRIAGAPSELRSIYAHEFNFEIDDTTGIFRVTRAFLNRLTEMARHARKFAVAA